MPSESDSAWFSDEEVEREVSHNRSQPETLPRPNKQPSDKWFCDCDSDDIAPNKRVPLGVRLASGASEEEIQEMKDCAAHHVRSWIKRDLAFNPSQNRQEQTGAFGESYAFRTGIPNFLASAPKSCRYRWLGFNHFNPFQLLIVAPRCMKLWLQGLSDQSLPVSEYELVLFVLHWVNGKGETGLQWDIALYHFENIPSTCDLIDDEDDRSWEKFFSVDGAGAHIAKVISRMEIAASVWNYNKIVGHETERIIEEYADEPLPMQTCDEIGRGDIVLVIEVKATTNPSAFVVNFPWQQIRLMHRLRRRYLLICVSNCPGVLNHDFSWHPRKINTSVVSNPLHYFQVNMTPHLRSVGLCYDDKPFKTETL